MQEQWSLKFTVLSLPQVTFSKSGSDKYYGKIDFSIGWEGILEFPGGRQYLWSPAQDKKSDSTISTLDGREVARIHPHYGLLTFDARVDIHPYFKKSKNLTPLLLITWFLLLIQ